MRRTGIGVSLAASVALTAAYATAPDTSFKYAPSVYREEVGRYTVLVDGFLASFHRYDDYVPIVIAVGAEGRGAPVRFTTESFVLVDAEGNTFPVAGFDEVQRGDTRREWDRTVLRQWPMVLGQTFRISTRVPARFFPTNSQGTRTPRVEIGPFHWFQDVLYFRRPDAGLDGVLTLTVRGEGMEEPVEVRFEVPRTDGDL